MAQARQPQVCYIMLVQYVFDIVWVGQHLR